MHPHHPAASGADGVDDLADPDDVLTHPQDPSGDGDAVDRDHRDDVTA
ncbi:MAG: hypothetical protein JOZ99_07405 [Actinobacteria bacterium]|nr:hypothetical protein [Actinomycetota bacterium]